MAEAVGMSRSMVYAVENEKVRLGPWWINRDNAYRKGEKTQRLAEFIGVDKELLAVASGHLPRFIQESALDPLDVLISLKKLLEKSSKGKS